MPLQFVLSEKGKNCLTLNGFVYNKEKTAKSGNVSWACYKRKKDKCKGRVVTTGDDIADDVVSEHPHQHAPEPDKIKAMKARAQIKEKALTTMDTPRNLIALGTIGATPGVAVMVKEDSVKRQIRRVRQDARGAPVVPPNLDQLVIPQDYQLTLDGRQFLAFDSGPGPDRILLFMSVPATELLRDNPKWFSDGTFKVCPTLFYQVYTISALVEEEVIPCAYALLANKTQATYTRLFQEIKSKGLVPQSVMTDFEMAAKNALKAAFPNVELKGCHFHMGQANWRKQQSLGFQELYTQDEEFAVTCRSFPALAFVPPNDVRDRFMELGRDMLERGVPDGFPEQKLEDFLIYFEKTYVGPTVAGIPRPPLHPIPEWNQYDATLNGDPRTNNQMEARHNAFQGSVGASHPSIWSLIDALKKEESLHQFRLLAILVGNAPAKRRRYMDAEDRILNRVRKYATTADKLSYMRMMAHNVKY